MARVLVLLSITCPHFDDKANALVALAGAAVESGHDVMLALAGTGACPHVARATFDPARCPEWHTRAALERRGLRADIEVLTVSADAALEEAVTLAWEHVRRVPAAQRGFGGYDLTELCAPSLARHLALGASPSTGDHEALEAEIHRDAIRHLLFYRRLLDMKRPDAVVHFGGHFHKDRVAFLACRERGVACAAIEGAFVPKHMYWDEAGVSGNRGLIARADGIDDLTDTPSATLLRSVGPMMERSFGMAHGEAESPWLDRETIRRSLGLDRSARLALFLAQVPYDASLVEDGGPFADPLHAVRAVREALDPGCALVVRLHPKASSEPLATALERSGASAGVCLVARRRERDPDLASLLRCADLAVTVSSQSGLQAAWLGLPVVVLGRAFYGAKGFTFDVAGNRAALQPALAEALAAGRASPSPRLLAYLALLQRDFLLPIGDVRPALHRLHRMLEKATT